ncbi:fimbrial protein [Providencia rettgeri]|uniref:fimbrial protein n=1 Tax=Providencia rettgeri TaxID=587 RepID=UPI0023623602|nr:fimbrial protein [Providencia rettgeri]
MKKLIFQSMFAIGCVYLYSSYANAACNQNPKFKNLITTLPSETIYIQYDDENSSQIYRKVIPIGNGSNETTSNGDQCGSSIMYGQYSNGWSSRADGYALTNIPNVYMQLSIPAVGIESAFNWSKNLPYNNANLDWISSGGLPWVVTLKKQGKVTQSGDLTAGNLAELYQTNTLPSYSRWSFSTLKIPANFKIVVLNCNLKNTVPIVQLGDWYDTQFPSIGSTSTEVDIPVTLSCLAGTNIKATVQATSGTVNAVQGQLALSGTDKATGVAIQLIDANQKPIPLGSKQTIKDNVAAGDYIFGWKARYIKTADKITPGSANASATVNIRYE